MSRDSGKLICRAKPHGEELLSGRKRKPKSVGMRCWRDTDDKLRAYPCALFILSGIMLHMWFVAFVAKLFSCGRGLSKRLNPIVKKEYNVEPTLALPRKPPDPDLLEKAVQDSHDWLLEPTRTTKSTCLMATKQPSALYLHAENYLVVCDTGASECVTCDVNDIVPGTFEETRTSVQALGNTVPLIGYGMIEWNLLDDSGKIRTIRVRGSVCPKGNMRLLSPQAYFRDQKSGGKGATLFVDKDCAFFKWKDGG